MNRMLLLIAMTICGFVRTKLLGDNSGGDALGDVGRRGGNGRPTTSLAKMPV